MEKTIPKKILLLNQMKLKNLKKMYGSGYYEALYLSEKFKEIIFLTYTTQKKPLKRKIKSNFIVYAYPFPITFKNLIIDSLKTFKNIIETTVFTIKLAKKHKIDLIRAEGTILWGIVAFLVKKIIRTPYTIYVVGDAIQALKEKYKSKIVQYAGKIIETLLKPIYREAENISTNHIDEYLKAKRENKKVLFLPTRIDLNKFKCDKEAFSGNTVTLMYVGRFDKEKGVHLLVKALKHQKLANIIYKIYIIGHGPLEKEITKLTQNDKRVKFIGTVDNKEMPSWYNKVDAIIVPSLTEGMPAVILEALSCQRLVIATSVGSIPLTLANGKYGILISPNNVKELISTIIEVTKKENRAKLKEIAKKGRKRARALIKLYEKNIVKGLIQ